jgi:hypothetical protein
MEDSQPAHILRAIQLGREIHQLEKRRAEQMEKVKEEVDFLETIDNRLRTCWLEVGCLRRQ